MSFYNLMSSELHISSTRTLWLWEQRIRFMMLQSGGWNMMNLIASLLWLTSLLKSGFLLKNFLSKTVQAEPLIQDNPECLKMVIIGMRYHPLSPEDREELVEGTRPRRKKHDYRIALFGGSQPQSCRYFLTQRWKEKHVLHKPGNEPITSKYSFDVFALINGPYLMLFCIPNPKFLDF